MGMCVEQVEEADASGTVVFKMLTIAKRADNWNILGQVCRGAAEFAAGGSKTLYNDAVRDLTAFHLFVANVKDDIGNKCFNKVITMLQNNGTQATAADLFDDWLTLLGQEEAKILGVQTELCLAAEKDDLGAVLDAVAKFAALGAASRRSQVTICSKCVMCVSCFVFP